MPGDTVKGKVLHARYSRYMQRVAEVAPELVSELAETGARFTHHSSIAPTGTISLSLANNASNGIEPSFAHHYFRNVIREGKKTKEKVDVFSFELLAYRELVNPLRCQHAKVMQRLPDYFIAADNVTPDSMLISRRLHRSGWIRPSPRPPMCRPIIPSRISRISTAMPTSRA